MHGREVNKLPECSEVVVAVSAQSAGNYAACNQE